MPTSWPTKASRESSGRGAGWKFTQRLLRLPRKTTPAGHGRRPIGAGPPASARSSKGSLGQLKDFFALDRHRANTLGGLLTRLAAKKIAAYTCAQQINDSLSRPLRHLADLLV